VFSFLANFDLFLRFGGSLRPYVLVFSDTRCRIYFCLDIYYKVGKHFLSVYARNSWMNKEQSINHTTIIQSSNSRKELSAVTYLNYVTLKFLRSAENPDNFCGKLNPVNILHVAPRSLQLLEENLHLIDFITFNSRLLLKSTFYINNRSFTDRYNIMTKPSIFLCIYG